MAKSASEIRREKLRNRQKQAVDNRDQKGLGRKSVLDWGRLSGKKPSSYQATKGKELNVIDFLPFKVTQDWYKDLRTFVGLTTNMDVGDFDYKLELPIHKYVGENNDEIICPRLAFGKKCPRCEAMFEEYAKEEPDEKITRKLNPSWRCWYNIYDYSEENNPDGKLSVWEDVSYHCFEKEILAESGEGEEEILWSDTEDGRTVEIKGKEKTLGKNKFVEAANVEFKTRDPYDDDIADETISFDALVKFMSYDEFKQIHDGEEKSEEEDSSKDEPKDEEPEKKTSNRRRRPEKTSVEEEDDIPFEVENGCPSGLQFGKPDMDSKNCKNCDDEVFDKCIALADKKEEPESEPEKEEEPEPEKKTTGRRRRRKS